MLTTPSLADDTVITSHSPRMQAVLDFLRVIHNSESTVLITGESGTGKDVTARLIHNWSPRSRQPFVPVSCALLSESLIESELFGYERGAFTDAIRDKPGRFELADGGTLFLDDIDDVPLSMQVKLLRVLQNRTVDRIGGCAAIPIDVRIVAGTKHDLRKMVEAGTFREDLFHRLNVLPVPLPPLRERREDVEMLATHFLARSFAAQREPPPAVTDTLRQIFLQYAWPGNIRELENVCERIAQTCVCGTVRIGCIPATLLLRIGADAGGTPVVLAARAPQPIALDDWLRHLETSLIGAALKRVSGNKSRAAELLHIRRTTLNDRIRRCNLVV